MSQDEDPLLEAISTLAREDREVSDLDERLESFSHGALEPADEAELERLAASDDALAEALDAYRPIGSERRAAIAEQAMQSLAETAAPNEAPTPAAAPERPWRWAKHAAVLIPIAAAAAWWFAVGSVGSPLPSYALTVQADATDRSDPVTSDVVTVSPGTRFRMVMTPSSTVSEALQARAELQAGDQRIPIPGDAVTVAPSGAVKVEGSRAAVFGTNEGSWRLRVVVGRPDTLTTGFTADASSGEGWTRFDVAIVLPP